MKKYKKEHERAQEQMFFILSILFKKFMVYFLQISMDFCKEKGRNLRFHGSF